MTNNLYDWDAIAEHPKFMELKTLKNRFLFGWWLFSASFFFLLPLGVGFFPELYRVKVLGEINFCFAFSLLQFVVSWGIAIFYAHKANKDFDRLTNELIAELG